MTDLADDPIERVVLAAAEGRFPSPDGGFTVVPPDATTGLHAVLSFTAHAVVATDRTTEQVAVAGVTGYEGAHAPATLLDLAGPGGWVGVLDVVLVARGTGHEGQALPITDRYDEHPRVAYAQRTRVAVEVRGDERGLVTLGRGLGGRRELGFESPLADPPPGTGRSLLRAALAAVPDGELVFASCAPGNARSLRALLATGFTAIGGEVLLRPRT